MRFPVVSQSSFLSLFDAVWLRCFKGVTESPLPPPFSCRLFQSAFWFFSPRSSCSLCLSFLPVPSPAVFRIAPPAFPVFSPVLPSCTFSPFSLHLYSLFIISILSSFSLLSTDPCSANPFLPCLSSVPGVRFSGKKKQLLFFRRTAAVMILLGLLMLPVQPSALP